MIKRIIFDIDNTLIPWEDEKNWGKVYEKLAEKNYNLTQEEYIKTQHAINNYETYEEIYNIEKMQKLINKAIQKQYTTEFIQIILKVFAECVPEQRNIELEQTLQYLSEKYEIVALTNWFGWQQEERLKKYNLLQYFKVVFSADNFKVKPSAEAFEIAMGYNKPEECVMIGDDMKLDIQSAVKCGINTIMFNPKNTQKELENNKYKTITNINQLKSIL